MSSHPHYIKHIVGGACIFVGFLALVTPLTPGSWLILVGIELIFGFRPAFVDKILTTLGTYGKKWARKTTSTAPIPAPAYAEAAKTAAEK